MTLQIQLKNRSKNLLKKQLVIVFSVFAIASLLATLTACAGSDASISKSSTSKASTYVSGNFMGAEHPTAGHAHIVQEGVKRYLVLDKTFQTDAGPDLFVIFHRAAMPKTYAPKDYILLGKLKSPTGEQRYEIPANVNPNAYRSVVIWCRQFNATFGYAKLTTGI
jgi:Electron transfer DM13